MRVLMMASRYGPKDNFHPEQSHVIPALKKSMVDAKLEGKNEVVVWGTGKPSREFLYIEDTSDGILMAAEKYEKAGPVNLGTGREIMIKDLVSLIMELTKYEGKILWDTSNPEGQPRRCLESSKAKKEFGFVAKISLEEGLRKTIEWYRISHKI